MSAHARMQGVTYVAKKDFLRIYQLILKLKAVPSLRHGTPNYAKSLVDILGLI
jgi:hypothetical protein